jgi:hypothetical protein
MEPSLKAKRGLCRTALQVLEWLQTPFAYVFWLIERRKACLQNLLTNEGRKP